ncbi:hypothetical protein EVAR_99910_1 [Eumeta japonica]|uniref:Uncharacterized protein n=1 Tax=Eumeta variegata TaxID=151549 RepID=A0A4C2A9K1_EUMVA|nr:hypothetical protein EVAR_99910_1 [Eumeta japonica]
MLKRLLSNDFNSNTTYFSSTETRKNSSTPSGRGRGAASGADISINKCPCDAGPRRATVVSSVIKCPLHATPTSPRNKLRQNLNTRKPLDTPAFAPRPALKCFAQFAGDMPQFRNAFLRSSISAS